MATMSISGTTQAQTTTSDNIIIRDNFFEQGDGEALVGINLEGYGGPLGFKNVMIDHNVIHNGDSQALRAQNVDGLTMTNNTLLQSDGGLNDAPLIGLVEGTKNALIQNNLTAGINGVAFDNAAANNIVATGNVIINYTDPESPNYVGNLFVQSSAFAEPASEPACSSRQSGRWCRLEHDQLQSHAEQAGCRLPC